MNLELIIVWYLVGCAICFYMGYSMPRKQRKKPMRRSPGHWETRAGRHAFCYWIDSHQTRLKGYTVQTGFVTGQEPHHQWNAYGHSLDGNRAHDLTRPWEDS